MVSPMKITGTLVALLLLTSCGGEEAAEPKADDGPPTFTAEGTIDLLDGGMTRGGGQCSGGDGYSDLSAGAVVIVRNATGDQVGLGELGPGEVQDSVSCTFDFTVEDIPDEGERFTVEVGKRGQVPFNRDEATDISLSLGY